jgi:hypothetical protein
MRAYGEARRLEAEAAALSELSTLIAKERIGQRSP